MYLDGIIFPLFADTVLQVTRSFKWKINLRCIKELIKKKTECNCLSTEVKYILLLQSISKYLVRMIRKYHNHKLQTNPRHCEEEPYNNRDTPGRQTKRSNQLSLPHQDDCKTRRDIK